MTNPNFWLRIGQPNVATVIVRTVALPGADRAAAIEQYHAHRAAAAPNYQVTLYAPGPSGRKIREAYGLAS